MGGRDKFAEIAQATHKVSDYKQILKWASATLSGLEPPEGAAPPAHDFAACDPGTIDDVAFTGVEPLKAFQRASTAHKAALGATAAAPAVDGPHPLHEPSLSQAGQASGRSRGWIQGDSAACGAGCSSGGGTVMGPISRASSIGSRRSRVVVQ